MATRIVYAYKDGEVYNANSTTSLLDAYTLPGLESAVTGGLTITVRVNNTSPYDVYQAFIAFELAGLTSASTAALALYSTNSGAGSAETRFFTGFDFTTNSTAEADSNDIRTVAQLQALTHVATITTVTANTYVTATDVDLYNNITFNARNTLTAASGYNEDNSTPGSSGVTGHVFSSIEGKNPPKLTFTDTSTQGSQTLAGGSTSFTPTVTGMHDVEMWGAGGKAATATGAKPGSQGGAYTFGYYNVTSLSSITVSVAATNTTNNSTGASSYWINTSTIQAVGGAAGTGTNSGGGGSSGILTFSSPAGTAAQGGGGSRGGSGGSGSAGTAGNGFAGTPGSGSSGGIGGSSGAGTTGAIGGNGGAGGGGAGQAGEACGGGGGGGGSSSGANGDGGAGKMIVYWYEYPAAGKAFPPVSMQQLFHHMIMR